MANYIKKEMENFEYDKRYFSPREHRWCYLFDDENYKKFLKAKDELGRHELSRTQSNPETTGQHGTMI